MTPGMANACYGIWDNSNFLQGILNGSECIQALMLTDFRIREPVSFTKKML